MKIIDGIPQFELEDGVDLEMFTSEVNEELREWFKDQQLIIALAYEQLQSVVETKQKALKEIATHAGLETNGKIEYESDTYGYILKVAKKAIEADLEVV